MHQSYHQTKTVVALVVMEEIAWRQKILDGHVVVAVAVGDEGLTRRERGWTA